MLGEGHPDTATSYNNLAANLQAQGKYADAEPLFRTALEIRRRVLGEGHPDTAPGYNNLAANLHAQGKHAEAEPLFRTALEIRPAGAGRGPPRHGPTLHQPGREPAGPGQVRRGRGAS